MTIDTFSALLSRGRELKEALDGLAPDASEERERLIGSIEVWLKACVKHGRFLPDPSADRRALQGRVDFWASLLARGGYSLPDIDRIDDFDPAAGLPLDDDKFPYPGLGAYGAPGRDRQADQKLFCGREQNVELWAAHLEQYPSLLLVSESGGGKSSLAMAGILPRLEEAHRDWLFAPRMTPGSRPVEALFSALRSKLPELAKGITPSEEDVGAWAKAVAQPILDALAGRWLLIFIDQLEELLTLCDDSRQQGRFSSLLAALAEGGHCRILATMRNDHQHQLANSQPCLPLFVLLAANDGIKTLAPLNFDQIRDAILRPAQSVGLRFVHGSGERDIVDELANQTANLVGGLPLLQFALWRLWKTRPTNVDGKALDFINAKQLEKLPSVQEALGTAAEQEYEDLGKVFGPAGIVVCKRLMLELTIPAENYEVPMRRRRPESEIVQILLKHGQADVTAEEELDEKSVRSLIARFVDAGLLVRSGEQIEVAHESLFRNWKTFDGWHYEAKARLKEVRDIAREAAQWAAAEPFQAADYLKQKGEPLARAREFAEEGWLDGQSSSYVEQCLGEEWRIKAEKAARVREKKWTRGIVAAIAVIVLAAYIWQQEKKVDALLVLEANNITLISPSLPPWDEMDLAHIYYDSAADRPLGKSLIQHFAAPMAHAMERIQDTELLGNGRVDGADFTAGGRVVIQLERREQDLPPKILHIYPIGSDGKVGMVDMAIDLGDTEHQPLVSVDVGPPDAAAGGSRLALLLFARKGQRGMDLGAWRLPAKGAPQPIGNRIPIESAGEVSEISFDSSGRFAVLSVKSFDSEEPKARVWVFGVSQANELGQSEVVIPPPPKGLGNGEGVVNAVAFRGDRPIKAGIESVSLDSLVTGRLDGSLYCGEKRLAPAGKASPDKSPVDALRVLPGSSTVAALQRSPALTLADCGSGTVSPVALEPSSSGPPLALMLDGHRKPGRLSYVQDKILQCVDIPPRNGVWKPMPCPVTRVPVYEAIPVGGQGDFLAIEDRTMSVVRFLAEEAPENHFDTLAIKHAGYSSVAWKRSDAADSPDQGGKPPGQEIQEWAKHHLFIDASGVATASVSPNGAELAWMERLNDGQLRLNLRHRDGSGSWHSRELAKDDSSQSVDFNKVAVNDHGEVAAIMTEEGAGETVHRLHIYGGDRPFSVDLAKEDSSAGYCMAFSADGSELLVTSEMGDSQVYTRGNGSGSLSVWKPLHGGNGPKGQDRPKKSQGQVTACDVANDGTAVLGREDGQVLYQPPGQDAPVPISELLVFKISGSVKYVSVAPGGRFIAALGERRAGSCPNSSYSGQSVRIWDLQVPEKHRGVPRSSTCFVGRHLLALGVPYEKDKDGWMLPLYGERGGSSGPTRSEHPCRACVRSNETAESTAERVAKEADEASPQPPDIRRLHKLYGIEIESP